MSIVAIVIYWFLILLSLGGYFAPDPWPKFSRFFEVILFIILGLKVFGNPF